MKTFTSFLNKRSSEMFSKTLNKTSQSLILVPQSFSNFCEIVPSEKTFERLILHILLTRKKEKYLNVTLRFP